VVSAANKQSLSDAAERLGAEVVLQKEPLGLADAISAGADDDDALILFGDCVIWGGSPVSRMSDLIFRGIDGCVAVEAVSDEDTRRYGILEVSEFSGQVIRSLEKPGPQVTSSRWAVAARYAFSSRLMSFLVEVRQKWTPSPGEELSLSPVLDTAIEAGFDIKAVSLQPGQERIDCGSPEEYATALRLAWD
jgi:dTDP-glucose pyrophosphorylase